MSGPEQEPVRYEFREPEKGESYDMQMATRVARGFLLAFLAFGAIFGGLLWLKLPG